MKPDQAFQALLREQVRRYPLMEIQDLVKLAYQSAFGCEHLIDQRTDSLSLSRLKQEYQSFASSQASGDSQAESVPLFEAISDDLSRIHLKALARNDLDLETVHQFFWLTASEYSGSQQRFDEALNQIRLAIVSGLNLTQPITETTYDRWLVAYRSQGCPTIHHSAVFRRAYQPAYRVVFRLFESFLPVFQRIEKLMKTTNPLFVAIDGNSGAGKSTLANWLKTTYGGELIHMDAFFLQPDQRSEKRLREAGGNIDYERFNQEVISGLTSKRDFSYRIYDCHVNQFIDRINVPQTTIYWVEGVTSHHPLWSHIFHLKVFLRTTPVQQRERLLRRNGPDLLRRFESEWIPSEKNYFKQYQIQQKADLIIDL